MPRRTQHRRSIGVGHCACSSVRPRFSHTFAHFDCTVQPRSTNYPLHPLKRPIMKPRLKPRGAKPPSSRRLRPPARLRPQRPRADCKSFVIIARCDDKNCVFPYMISECAHLSLPCLCSRCWRCRSGSQRPHGAASVVSPYRFTDTSRSSEEFLFSLLVGGGLMALVFYSNRHGYDDDAHRFDK